MASKEPNVEASDSVLKAAAADPPVDEEDDDRDFITNERKRLLKELRKMGIHDVDLIHCTINIARGCSSLTR